MKKILVSDVMTRNPITISPKTSLLECAKIMVRKRVGSLIIKENKKLLGIISEKDILWALVKKRNPSVLKTEAIKLSPKKIITINPNATIEEAIKKMNKQKFDRLPVVINGNELLGIVTIKDILAFHPEYYPELDEYAKIREEQEKLKRIKSNVRVFEGICEECGNWSQLSRVNGMLVCEGCNEKI
ncbi:MAG: CBS domain-containing protein [Candidatus Pacearchaeota archaeon]|nr:MAG: CBS domain-containing protein [Candidatus Pacearchaeota archaeon]